MGKGKFQISIKGLDKKIICEEDEALLIALEKQGFAKIPVGCRKGGCGICKIKILEGEFNIGKMSIKHVSLAERKMNFSLACKTFPKSDLRLEIFKKNNKVITIRA